jgi:hypothetical protein
VRAHILAGVLWKTLEQWHVRAGLGHSPRTILEELHRILHLVAPVGPDGHVGVPAGALEPGLVSSRGRRGGGRAEPLADLAGLEAAIRADWRGVSRSRRGRRLRARCAPATRGGRRSA